MVKVPFKWPKVRRCWTSWVGGKMGGAEDFIRPEPQSCEMMLGARLQVRPVPSGSTFSAFTTPLSITMENLRKRVAAAQAEPVARAPSANGGFVHFTSSAGDSQRETPKNHLVVSLSPRRQAETCVKSPQTGQGLLPT